MDDELWAFGDDELNVEDVLAEVDRILFGPRDAQQEVDAWLEQFQVPSVEPATSDIDERIARLVEESAEGLRRSQESMRSYEERRQQRAEGQTAWQKQHAEIRATLNHTQAILARMSNPPQTRDEKIRAHLERAEAEIAAARSLLEHPAN